MICAQYTELSYQEKITMILSASYNRLLCKFSTAIHPKIILVEQFDDLLQYYIWNGGIDVENWDIPLQPGIEHSEEAILREIDDNALVHLLATNDKRTPKLMAGTKKLCRFRYGISDRKIYIVPIVDKSVQIEGLFFQELYNTFISKWREVFENFDEYKLLDFPDCYAAADDTVNITDCIIDACAQTLSYGGFMDGIGDPYDRQRMVYTLNEIAESSYEKRVTMGTVAAIPDSLGINNIELCLDICFVKSSDFIFENARTLRKLVEMSTENIALVIRHSKVIGLSDKNKFEWFIQFNGKGGWSLYKTNKVILSFEKGRFIMPVVSTTINDWLINNSFHHIKNLRQYRQ